jgi:hypothetical protein
VITQQVTATQPWEYRQLVDPEFEQVQALGREGWELVSAVPSDRAQIGGTKFKQAGSKTKLIYIFKKPVLAA